MKILVTGAKGFIGKNLVSELKNIGYKDIYEFDIDTPKNLLENWCKNVDFVFHLAGVNRTENKEDFMDGNFGFTSELLNLLEKHGNKSPIVLSSSIQAELDNPYGRSKKAGEDLLLKYGEKNDTDIFIFRFPNIFGKWSKPNYNTVIATFCYNISRDIPISIHDENTEIVLVYIDDVVKELIRCIESKNEKNEKYYRISKSYKKSLGEIASSIYSFKESRNTFKLIDFNDEFLKKLYSTYLSFLPIHDFNYNLISHSDDRGSFTEFLKGNDFGQVSINIINPGFIKGNHWHHTKTEKFLVVKGEGIISFRNIFSDEIIEYKVNAENPNVVDIPPGYTHNIKNCGDSEMITLMWANELYDKENPDTYFLEV